MTKPDFRVFVFSLPRCGSSMMTGICERLGVDMKYTTEDEDEIKKREDKEQKRYGDTYRMNPKFYEIAKNQFANWHDIYVTPYSGAKVIIPVNGMRWDAVTSRPAKVIMMWRDPAEIRQSQEASYKTARATYTGPDDIEPWEHAEACLRTRLAACEVQLRQRAKLSNASRFGGDEVKPFDFMVVKYRDVLANPKAKITEIANWIQADPKLIDCAVASVDCDRIRFKKEELSEGI